MPKNKQRKNDVVTVPFQMFLTTAMSAGALQVSLNPGNFSHLAEIFTGFSLFRFTKLGYQLLQRPSATAAVVVGYYPDAIITAPGGLTQAMENIDAIYQSAVSTVTVPIRGCHWVPPSRLRGQLSWYKCTADTGDTGFESQGVLMFTGTAAEAVQCIVQGVCEFKNPVDASIALSNMKQKIRNEVVAELNSQISTAVASPLALKSGLRPSN